MSLSSLRRQRSGGKKYFLELSLCTDAGTEECHCMLFITPDNEFAGEEQIISLDYIQEVRESMKGH